MSIQRIGSPIDIAISGMRAQAMRMNVYSNNIASSSARNTEGTPYRRKEVVLSTAEGVLNGVGLGTITDDNSTEFERVYQPGHPYADEEGYVSMPNVSLPVELMNLVAASRAYQANAAVMKRYQDMVNSTLQLLR